MNLATSAITFGPAIQQYTQYLNFLASQPNPLIQLQGNQLNTLIDNADQLVIASDKSLQTLNAVSRTVQNEYLNMATSLKSTIQAYGYGERYNNPAENAQQKALLANFLAQYSAIKIPCRSTTTMGKTRSTFCRLYEAIEMEYKEIQRLSLQNDFNYLLKDVEKYSNRQDLTIPLIQVKQNLSELQTMISDPTTNALLGANLLNRYEAVNQAHMNKVAQEAIRQEQVSLSTQQLYPGSVSTQVIVPELEMQQQIQSIGESKGIGSFGQVQQIPESIYLKSLSDDEDLSKQFRKANLEKKRRLQMTS